MGLPTELLDELVAIVRRVARHELDACAGVRVADDVLASIAGNAVQCMSGPLERFARACMIAQARADAPSSQGRHAGERVRGNAVRKSGGAA